ncbi:hypothetical protein SLEP1_g1747 [Rubroshorea leprosula]|uniref:Uncharacterized protein n=2 Tax=Rubroshorea leprosula TaxID=152421 RepID=A0AAV5HLY2_9ROSI|nr:hypothetical protein SLEP1_g1747 [Rubroshorea leprosula]
MMMVVKDEWVRAAMTDDRVVVELLVRLKQAQAAPPAPKSAVAALKWGIRQPRSRSLTMRCDGSNKKDGDSNISTRGSPTTPLSWSGGGGAASPSTADGFEETSRHVHRSLPAPASRSKGAAASETTSTTSKRSRRKKTFAELKEEEYLLLKERFHLKKEIASMRATFKEQTAKNENLKRMKLDLNLNTANNGSLSANERDEATSSQSQQRIASSQGLDDDKSLLGSCKAVSNEGNSFPLPDLNMMPSEDDSGPETFYGTS